jgi:hypothetical protein
MFLIKTLIIWELIALTAQNADAGFVFVFAVFQVNSGFGKAARTKINQLPIIRAETGYNLE